MPTTAAARFSTSVTTAITASWRRNRDGGHAGDIERSGRRPDAVGGTRLEARGGPAGARAQTARLRRGSPFRRAGGAAGERLRASPGYVHLGVQPRTALDLEPASRRLHAGGDAAGGEGQRCHRGAPSRSVGAGELDGPTEPALAFLHPRLAPTGVATPVLACSAAACTEIDRAPAAGDGHDADPPAGVDVAARLPAHALH